MDLYTVLVAITRSKNQKINLSINASNRNTKTMKNIFLIITIMIAFNVNSQTNIISNDISDMSYISNNIYTYNKISISSNLYFGSDVYNDNISISNVPTIEMGRIYLFLFSKEQWNILTNFYKGSTTIESLTFYR